MPCLPGVLWRDTSCFVSDLPLAKTLTCQSLNGYSSRHENDAVGRRAGQVGSRVLLGPRSSVALLRRRSLVPVALLALLCSALGPVFAAELARTTEPPACATVRLSDIGWSDVTTTTAALSTVLRKPGYHPAITVRSVPVGFASRTRGDINVVLGNWMPAMQGARATALAVVRGTSKLIVGMSLERWLADHKIPVGDTVAVMIEYSKAHGRLFFNAVSTVIRGSVDGLTGLLRAVPWPVLILGLGLLGWMLRRSWKLALFVVAALLFIMNQGYWEPTLETLSLVIVAAVVCSLIGVPIGIAAAHRPRLYAALRPVLDLMQTLPTFVYLIPTLVLFGLGVVPGLISTVIFALPAPIRLTQLGISAVPKPLIEAGEAFGATKLQMLLKIELPSAAPTILAGITQCIMLSLSMVVIAALVGAGGLGVPVVRALNTVQVGTGFEAGFVIVLLAIVLDRITRPAETGTP